MLRTLKMLFLATGVLMAGCSKDVTLETRYVIKPLLQASSDDRRPTVVEGASAFAYNVDTTLWKVASYEDALQRIITHKETGEKLTDPVAVSEPYVGGETAPEQPAAADEGGQTPTQGWLQLHIGSPLQMVVVVEPLHKTYAYTNQKLVENLHTLYASVVFQPWKESASYLSGGWSFYRDDYVPHDKTECVVRPSAQLAEGGETQPVESMKIYAYAVDTVEWGIPTYDDAARGVIVRKKNGDKRSNPDFNAYPQGQSGEYRMEVNHPLLMVVAVDRTHRIYAYTRREIDFGDQAPLFTPVFPVWRTEGRYASEGWSFTNEKYMEEKKSAPKTEREQ